MCISAETVIVLCWIQLSGLESQEARNIFTDIQRKLSTNVVILLFNVREERRGGL